MKKTGIFLLIFMLVSLCGCSGADFISRPCSSDPAEIAAYALPSKYFDREEFIIPENRSSAASFFDCDCDGVDELIVCTSTDSSAKPKISLRVFSKTEVGYEPFYSVTNYGSVIDRLEFMEFSDGDCGIVFGWGSAGAGLYEINIFGFTKEDPELLYKGVYERLEIYDIDGNGENELLLMTSGSDSECGLVSQLAYANGRLETMSEAELSEGLRDIEAWSVGDVGFKLGALLCEGYVKDRGYVTDCIVSIGGKLTNLFRAESTGISNSTMRSVRVWSKDIDGDGCIEIPAPRKNPDSAARQAGCFIDWLRPATDGSLNIICTTYNSFGSGWYMILPDGVGSGISAELTLDRDDIKCTLFKYDHGNAGRQDAVWAVYEFIGETAGENMRKSGLSEAASFHDRKYCVALYNVVNPLKYTSASLASDFHYSDKFINNRSPGIDQ